MLRSLNCCASVWMYRCLENSVPAYSTMRHLSNESPRPFTHAGMIKHLSLWVLRTSHAEFLDGGGPSVLKI